MQLTHNFIIKLMAILIKRLKVISACSERFLVCWLCVLFERVLQLIPSSSLILRVLPTSVRPSGSTCHLLVLHSLNLVILVFPWWLNVTVLQLPRKLDNKPSSSLPPSKSIIWRTTCRATVSYKVRGSNFFYGSLCLKNITK